ncbi:Hypothetical predicted protein [Paramuricea clavata]|uniref:Uncharacterized protein n=1 Tax=Paramuricea clavata TaxID=317549 RepID=A0A6S7HUT4_PARCT|nr:Hypothetical predicted protein [Paramuricea clavata]
MRVFSVSDIATWSLLEKLKSLEFTSVVLGAAAGFTTCLLITACPYLLKRLARSLREKYQSRQDEKIPKLLPFTQQQSPLNPPLPPPLPPPPPAVNWRPVPVLATPRHAAAWRQPAHQKEMANNLFMDELLKAFKTFNFDANKQFGKSSDKPP